MARSGLVSPQPATDHARDPEIIKLVEALATGIRRYFAANPPLHRNRQL